MIEAEIFHLLRHLPFPAVIGLGLIILNRAGIFHLMADFLRSKINGNTDTTTNEKLDAIEKNHLISINQRLSKLEENDKILEIRIITLIEKVAKLEATMDVIK